MMINKIYLVKQLNICFIITSIIYDIEHTDWNDHHFTRHVHIISLCLHIVIIVK